MLRFKKRKSISDLDVPRSIEAIRKRIKIVVIDDDEFSFPYQLLSQSGYTIEWWNNIDERKLDRLEKNNFDIIILDINDITSDEISKKDGYGILERLKEVNPSQIIIAFSGREYDIEKSDFFIKADDRLSKPVDFIKAKNTIDRIINQKVTLSHFWDSLYHYLKKNGVEEKKIRKVEKELIDAFSNQRKVNYEFIKTRALNGLEISGKVIGIITRLVELIGS